MQKSIYLFLFAAALFITACEPQQDDKIDIGLPPENVTFSIEPTGTPNTFALANTTEGAFLFTWEFDGNTVSGESVEAFFQKKGSYEIKLTAFTKGGSATGSQVLEVPEDAPANCETDIELEFLTDCAEKVWKLKPSAACLWVGPVGAAQTWWSLPAAEVATRTCAFNDEWAFTKDGAMNYDTKGDIWAEAYMGFNFECIAESQLAANQAVWGTGSHTFTITPGSPAKLTVSGLGAYIGLPKVANGAEVAEPQQSVTYDIIRMDKGTTEDEMELEINFGAGIWRFILVSA